MLVSSDVLVSPGVQWTRDSQLRKNRISWRAANSDGSRQSERRRLWHLHFAAWKTCGLGVGVTVLDISLTIQRGPALREFVPGVRTLHRHHRSPASCFQHAHMFENHVLLTISSFPMHFQSCFKAIITACRLAQRFLLNRHHQHHHQHHHRCHFATESM